MKIFILFVVLIFISYDAEAQHLDAFFKQSDAFFKANVVNGKVGYNEIKNDPKALEEVLKMAEDISVTKSDTSVYQAFWINAYNLSVIKGIIDNYPINSPLDDQDFFDKTKYNIAGKKITLNEIEHQLLRAQFKDPRFHFVLVCGAIGCPPLLEAAYMPKTLNTQLDVQTRLAINGSFVRVNKKKNRVEVSQLMEWYKEDFTLNNNTEIDFINNYRSEKVNEKYKLYYFPYNWNLNKQ